MLLVVRWERRRFRTEDTEDTEDTERRGS